MLRTWAGAAALALIAGTAQADTTASIHIGGTLPKRCDVAKTLVVDDTLRIALNCNYTGSARVTLAGGEGSPVWSSAVATVANRPETLILPARPGRFVLQVSPL